LQRLEIPGVAGLVLGGRVQVDPTIVTVSHRRHYGLYDLLGGSAIEIEHRVYVREEGRHHTLTHYRDALDRRLVADGMASAATGGVRPRVVIGVIELRHDDAIPGLESRRVAGVGAAQRVAADGVVIQAGAQTGGGDMAVVDQTITS